VTEVSHLIDGLYQPQGKGCGAFPDFIRRSLRLRETAIFHTCRAIAKQPRAQRCLTIRRRALGKILAGISCIAE
jgi:hypothetical protein